MPMKTCCGSSFLMGGPSKMSIATTRPSRADDLTGGRMVMARILMSDTKTSAGKSLASAYANPVRRLGDSRDPVGYDSEFKFKLNVEHGDGHKKPLSHNDHRDILLYISIKLGRARYKAISEPRNSITVLPNSRREKDMQIIAAGRHQKRAMVTETQMSGKWNWWN